MSIPNEEGAKLRNRIGVERSTILDNGKRDSSQNSPQYVSFEDEFSEEVVHPYSNEILGNNLLPERTPTFTEAVRGYIRERCEATSLRSVIKSTFPILFTFKEGYSFEAAKADFIAGLTLGTVLIPQSLAYAPLAGLPSNYGLYCAFIASVLYTIMGSGREVSVGPFALVSLVLAQQVYTLHPDLYDIDISDPVRAQSLHITYVMTYTFAAGLLLLAMGLLRMGWIVSLLSGPATAGFIMASSLTISTSQVAAVLQVSAGQGSVLQMWINIFKNIAHTNLASVLVGLICCCILCVTDIVSKRRGMRVPPPMQIILVVVVTAISALLDLHGRFGVRVVGAITQGYATPGLPDIAQLPDYLPGAVTVALVCFIVTASVGKHAATQGGYTVNMNSELLALGTTALVGSLCNGYVASGSISRTAVVMTMRPYTALWNVTCGITVLLAMFTLAPLIFHLPNALLGAIIIASFRTTYMRITEVSDIWRRSPAEAMVYLCAFLATFIFSTEWGLVVSFVASLGYLVLQLSRPRVRELRRVRGTMEYRNPAKYAETRAEPRVLIVRVDSRLHFANVEFLEDTILRMVNAKLEDIDAAAAAHHTTASLSPAPSDLPVSHTTAHAHAAGAGADADAPVSSLALHPASASSPGPMPVDAQVLLAALVEQYAGEFSPRVELVLVLCSEGVNSVDVTATTHLARMLKKLQPRVHVLFYGLKEQVKRVLRKDAQLTPAAMLHWHNVAECVQFARACVDRRVREREAAAEAEAALSADVGDGADDGVGVEGSSPVELVDVAISK